MQGKNGAFFTAHRCVSRRFSNLKTHFQKLALAHVLPRIIQAAPIGNNAEILFFSFCQDAPTPGYSRNTSSNDTGETDKTLHFKVDESFPAKPGPKWLELTRPVFDMFSVKEIADGSFQNSKGLSHTEPICFQEVLRKFGSFSLTWYNL